MTLSTLISDILQNPVFSGVAGGSLVLGAVTFIGYQLRSAPVVLWGILRSQASVSLTIHGDQPVFHAVNMWLSRHPAVKRSRRLMTVTEFDGGDDTGEHRLTLGAGPHMIRQGKRLWLVNREVNVPGQQGVPMPSTNAAPTGRTETITLTTFGRDPAVFRRFLANVKVESEAADSVPIFVWNDGWFRPIGRRPRRAIDTVFMDAEQRDALVCDLRAFLGSRSWYAQRGIPWRRGVLLEGPPGTGKTSLIFAIAGELRRPIYLVNPSTLNGDAHLQTAMTGARNGILVLEDIDAAFAAQSRGALQMADSPPFGMREQITLSGLLNAIDGIGAQDGRILFLTSNYPDKLDAALLRPGRIDRRERLGLAGADVARAMFESFFPEQDAELFVSRIAAELPLAPADLQNRLLMLANDRARNPVALLQKQIADAA